MATLRLQAIPLNDYQNGVRTFGPLNIPDTAKTLYFEVSRCTTATPTIWPNDTTRLQLDLEGSTDGVNWTPAGGFGSFGGIHVAHGVEAPISTAIFDLPPLTGRKLRATSTITGGPLRTEGFVELRD